jgi:hypothetical protein
MQLERRIRTTATARRAMCGIAMGGAVARCRNGDVVNERLVPLREASVDHAIVHELGYLPSGFISASYRRIFTAG